MTVLKSQRGFSLIEMAIVLLIVSSLLGGLLLSLSATQELNNRRSSEAQIDEIIEALYGFAQANGRLPCPATVASAGAEAPAGGGNCTQDVGFVPAATLGLAGPVNGDNLFSDAWLSPFRYAVSDANGNAFTTTGRMRTLGMATLAPDLRVCSSAACSSVIAAGVPAVVLSLGANWSAFSGTDEVENSGEATINGYRQGNDEDFVSASYIEDVYDDLISWISPSILYTRMINAGQLP